MTRNFTHFIGALRDGLAITDPYIVGLKLNGVVKVELLGSAQPEQFGIGMQGRFEEGDNIEVESAISSSARIPTASPVISVIVFGMLPVSFTVPSSMTREISTSQGDVSKERRGLGAG